MGNEITRLYSVGKSRRNVVNLCLAFFIAFLLLLLNVLINMSEHVNTVLRQYAQTRVTGIVVNGLFFWLAILLWLAFLRWRSAARQRSDLEDIVSSINPDVLLVVSQARTILMCNASIFRVFGYTPQEVLNGRTDLLYFDRRTRQDSPREIYEALRKEGFHIGTATGRKKNGETLPLEIISGELRGHDGAVLLLRDISERLRMEAEQERLETQSQQSQRLESLGVLAGGIAYDFKNLVGIMQGHADLVLAGDKAGTVRDNMMEIEKATNRAVELCGHLLSFAGKEAAVLRPVDLSAIVRETLGLMRISMPASVLLDIDLPNDLPAVQGDAAQMQQMAMNLIKNALQALGAHAGTLSVRTDVREFDASALCGGTTTQHLAPGRYVCLHVGDSGCGMDERTRQRIFDPFFTTKPDGHGMGLAAVLGLARGHNGGIKVASAPGAGSTFTILFPLPKDS
jgi:PAS domain S-box-containing protein